MDYAIETIGLSDLPALREIPEPPEKLYLRGLLPGTHLKRLAVVGSRNYTTYGKQVVDQLVGGLKGYPVSIVSGLALGIDALAHEAALRAGLHTISVPGSGLDDSVIYPKQHISLASRILSSGGALLSEYDPYFTATTWSFPKRNRIMAGLADAVLVIEATERSGTLITARLATEYNRDLLVVPGSIFSESTQGPHQFLKLGAIPATTAEDIVHTLGIDREKFRENAPPSDLSLVEQKVLEILREPKDKDTIVRELALPADEVGILLMQMELGGHIEETNGVYYYLRG